MHCGLHLRATSGDLRAPASKSTPTSGQPQKHSKNTKKHPQKPPRNSKISRCLQLRRLRHCLLKTPPKSSNQTDSEKVANLRCRGTKQAKTHPRHKRQNENAPINQSTKQSGNQAISTPQQQLASQYRNQSVGRMARRKKLTTTSTCVNHYHLDDG